MRPHRRPPTRLLCPWDTEHWSGLPFPSPMQKVKSKSEVAQSCPTLSDPMDCSLPGSSVHGFPGKSTRVGCHCLLPYFLCTNHILQICIKTKRHKWRNFYFREKLISWNFMSNFHSDHHTKKKDQVLIQFNEIHHSTTFLINKNDEPMKEMWTM